MEEGRRERGEPREGRWGGARLASSHSHIHIHIMHTQTHTHTHWYACMWWMDETLCISSDETLCISSPMRRFASRLHQSPSYCLYPSFSTVSTHPLQLLTTMFATAHHYCY